MEDDARDAARLWKVNKTLREMASDRGYNITSSELNQSLDEFASAGFSRSSMGWEAIHKEDQKNKLIIHFVDVENVAKKDIKTFIQIMEERSGKHGILVYKKKMTPAARKVIQELQSEYQLEEYAETDLIVNITKHFLVPKHEVMKPEDKKLLLTRYRLKETQLPRIQITDPVARYFGVRRGQVMKITRESETAGRYVTYRIVL